MTDTNQKISKQLLLAGILLLVAIVGVQTWYMIGMKEQLNVIHEQQVTSNPLSHHKNDTTTASKPAAPLPPPPLSQQTQPAKPGTMSRPHSLFDDDFFNAAPYDAQTWNPYEEIQRMRRDMDRMFNDTFSRFNTSPGFQHLFREGFTTPQMDIQEDNDKYTVIINLPGSSEDNVSVNLDGQTLTVKGEQKSENLDKDSAGNIIFQERRSGSFQRSITLPGPVKQTGMETYIDNGVLTITLPKDM